MAAKEEWYAIRTAPGAQRMARAMEGLPVNRIGESIIERNLRNEGIDVYMPAYWHEIVHHRTNKIIERRLPLLVGYAFVHLPRLNFEEVRTVEGVICLLRGNREFGPVRFRVDDIAVMANEELRRRQEIRRDKIVRFEKEKSSKLMHLRGNLRKILKKGRSTRCNVKEQALLAIDSMDEQSKNAILGILKELDSLEAYDGLAEVDRVA